MSRTIQQREEPEQAVDVHSDNGTAAGAAAAAAVSAHTPVKSKTAAPCVATTKTADESHTSLSIGSFDSHTFADDSRSSTESRSTHAKRLQENNRADSGEMVEIDILQEEDMPDKKRSSMNGSEKSTSSTSTAPPKRNSSISLGVLGDDDSDDDTDDDSSAHSIKSAHCIGISRKQQGTTVNGHGRRRALCRHNSSGALGHGSFSSLNSLRGSNNIRRKQMAKSVSNPRLQLSPKRSVRSLHGNSSWASVNGVNKKVCAPPRPKHLQPVRRKSDRALQLELSHTTGTGNAVEDRPPASATSKRSSTGLLSALLDKNRQDSELAAVSLDDPSTSDASFQSRHTFRPSNESMGVEKLENLSNLDISLADHAQDIPTDTTFASSRSSPLLPRRFPTGFTAHHHRVTSPKRISIRKEEDQEPKSGMFSTFSNNLSYLGSFVGLRQTTFTKNITTIAELVTNQREIITEDDDGSSAEFREQERWHRNSRKEHHMATYLWGE